MSSRPGRPLQRGEGRPGPAADQQALERLAADPAAASTRSARAAVDPATVEDRWILSRLERAQAEVAGRIERYDFSHAALALYDFVYGELCDWYLELVKPRLYEGEPAAAPQTLLHVLTETLALAHPMIPFVTEEIYALHARAPRGCSRRGCEPAAATSTRRPRRRSRARSRRSRRCAPGATRPGSRPAPSSARGWPPTGYEETAEHIARLARLHSR